MKIDKSLEEVWKWKDEIYQETKNMAFHRRVEHINKNADDFCKRYGIKLKTSPSDKKIHNN